MRLQSTIPVSPFVLVTCVCIFLLHASTVLAAVPDLRDLRQDFVNDQAGVFSTDQVAALRQQFTAYERNSTVEFAVVTVQALEGIALEDYSLAVAEHLGLGKQDTDNGLLLFIAVDDRQYRFEVGYGLEGALPDGRIGRIGREILVPAFQRGEYYEGVSQAMDYAYGFASNDSTTISRYQATYGDDVRRTSDLELLLILGLILLLFGSRFFFFPVIIGGGHHRGGRGGFGGGGFGGGGFGGFGGGGFGGGGAGGRW